jgi:hypothetical protein
MKVYAFDLSPWPYLDEPSYYPDPNALFDPTRGREAYAQHLDQMAMYEEQGPRSGRTEGPPMSSQSLSDQRGRRLNASFMLGAAASLLLASCSGAIYPPTYSQAELKAICERRGGWWRGDLIPGYCEYQAASLIQAP